MRFRFLNAAFCLAIVPYFYPILPMFTVTKYLSPNGFFTYFQRVVSEKPQSLGLWFLGHSSGFCSSGVPSCWMAPQTIFIARSALIQKDLVVAEVVPAFLACVGRAAATFHRLF